MASGCSWLLPRFFPETVHELPPRPLKEYYCPSDSAQIVGPHGPTNLALAEFWKNNPKLTVAHIFRLLVLSSSHNSPHLLGPESQQETLHISKINSSKSNLEKLTPKLKASTARELINGPLFNLPYSERELKMLDQLQRSMVVGDSLEKFLISKLKVAQRKKDQTYFHKNNGHLLNQGDPLPVFSLIKSWKPSPSLGAKKSQAMAPTWTELSTKNSTEFQCFYHQMPAHQIKSLSIDPFPSEILFLSVIAKNGEAIIGLFGQNSATMKIMNSSSPYWKGRPTSLGYWCQMQQQIIVSHGRPEIGQWTMDNIIRNFLDPKDANEFQENGRVILASSPLRVLVESERLSEEQLKETLSQKISPFYEKNLGRVNILIPTKKSHALTIDPRMTEELTCF